MPSELARHWDLDSAVRFLNHGSYGAAPRAVLDAQRAWRDRMEREPVAFLARDLEPAMDAAREELAAFVGADASGMAFVHNASTAIATVLGSVALTPGDELLTTDHAYNAVKNQMERAAAQAGARVVIAHVPFPGATPETAAEAILAAASSRTRLAVLDHVTSATALRVPIGELVAELDARGIDTLVDGAHAPGMLPLDVDTIGAAYYSANCHKWLCAPKGSGFLHVRADRRDLVRPLVISHGATSPRTDRSSFHLEFDWTGTDDPTAYLAVPAAIRFGAGLLPGGWPALYERNRSLAIAARDLLCDALAEPEPASDEMLGAMASVLVRPGSGAPARDTGLLYDEPLHASLIERGIQVAVASWPRRADGGPSRRLVRVSAAAYNDIDDMRALAEALRELVARPAA
jgi:isopenicillin-N epimerase